jgi:NADH-quinone oxidoreductase subunit A
MSRYADIVNVIAFRGWDGGGDDCHPTPRPAGAGCVISPALEKQFTSARSSERMHGWVPILIMIGLGAGFGAFNILLSHLVGPRKPTPEKLAPYECGMPPVGDARERHPVKFYLVAMIFLLFDIEVAFLYPFAMALRELRWFGFIQLLVFFAILLTGYIYVWRKGVLDWGHERN